MLQTWEHHLLSLARVLPAEPGKTAAHFDAKFLEQAYRYCNAFTAQHSRSFYTASGLVSREKRQALRALYAFCRITDDLIDCPQRDCAQQLNAWRQIALSSQPPSNHLIALAWADTRQHYRIPLRYAEQLIDGVERDLCQQRYQTFEDLTTYAYGVASTVGLMSMYIIGFSGQEAIPYAIKLGVALQITNILRDVGEDWRAGRCYLPLEDLTAFGITDADLAAGRVNDAWREIMHFQIERNRRLYDEAEPGIAMLDRDGRLAVAAAGAFYRAILDDIEAHDYDVFTRRAHISAARKLSLLPGLWWRFCRER